MITVFFPLAVISMFVLILALTLRSRFLIHMLQLEGYRNNNFSKWIKEFNHRAYSNKVKIGSLAAILSMIISMIVNVQKIGFVAIVAWCAFMVYSASEKREKAKVDLVYTKRVKRLIAIHAVVNILIVLIVSILSTVVSRSSTSLIKIAVSSSYIISTIQFVLQPLILKLSNNISVPIENSINKKFFVQAQNKIKGMKDLNIVGITGSYGKTSTKFLTATILEEKFKTLKTPESYNTPMGVSIVINNQLDESYEVFVAEMGARNIGDIKEMSELVGHKIGIITSVGPAHLETFKNIENIKKTKYEIIDALPEDGIAIFNYDNPYVRDLADKTEKFKKIIYGIDTREEADVYARDIKVMPTGSEFVLGTRDGNEVKCKSQLLGEHNILNLLAGASAGIALGMSLEEIARGIAKVEPVPHRLQLINPGTGIIIIDDAFNSNPDGAKAALDVLSKFEEGRKIVITPGMIELGDSEYEENKEFGRNIARTADFAILVGEDRAIPIKEGIEEVGFDAASIFVVKSLDQATQVLQNLTKPKDVVLFENDLPDNYNK